VETTAPSTLATTAGSPEIRLWSPASHAISLGQTQRSCYAANLWRKLRRPLEPARELKATSRPAHM
jgi:hypothetical protein